MYTIRYSNGSTSTHDTLGACEAEIIARWPDAEIGHDMDLQHGGDRTLFWEDEEDAENDSGAKALGEIRRA